DLAPLDARPARRRLEPVEQPEVALAGQRVERDRLRRLALGGEQLDERPGGCPLRLFQLLDLAPEMAYEHVDVAPAAECAAEPVQLVAQRLRPGRVEHRACGAE